MVDNCLLKLTSANLYPRVCANPRADCQLIWFDYLIWPLKLSPIGGGRGRPTLSCIPKKWREGRGEGGRDLSRSDMTIWPVFHLLIKFTSKVKLNKPIFYLFIQFINDRMIDKMFNYIHNLRYRARRVRIEIKLPSKMKLHYAICLHLKVTFSSY